MGRNQELRSHEITLFTFRLVIESPNPAAYIATEQL